MQDTRGTPVVLPPAEPDGSTDADGSTGADRTPGPGRVRAGGVLRTVLGAPLTVRACRSNASIAAALVVSAGTVEKHVAAIFAKLGPESSRDHNRRVLAVIRHLHG